MAAQALVRESYVFPVETYETNVMGTVHVLEAVRQTPSARVVINVTTDKCYENKEWHWGYREVDTLGGHDPYANSKACSELVSAAYRTSFFEEKQMALATVRAGNVIGGGDWAKDRLIPDIMRAFLQEEPVYIRYPNAIRPWQHVLEPLSGYLMLAERLWENNVSFAESWNFGPDLNDAKPVRWIADYLVNAWPHTSHYSARWVGDTDHHPHESMTLRLDCAKAKDKLGWAPRLPLLMALDWITDWYTAYREGGDLRAVTLEQIARYEALMLDEDRIPA
jgi:CDP-glucose 4,6-dehydratase